jgi:hypothetical protein
LSAVACHSGSNTGGHFYVYVKRKHKKNNAWFNISDSSVGNPVNTTDKNFQNQINAEGVMFLYRKNENPDNLPEAKGLVNQGNTCYLNSLMQVFNTTHLITNKNSKYPKFRTFVNEVFKDSSYYNNFITDVFGELGRQQDISEALTGILYSGSKQTEEIAVELETNDKNNFFLMYPLYSCVKKKCPTGDEYETIYNNELLNIAININSKKLKTQRLVYLEKLGIKIKVIPTKYDPKDTNTDYNVLINDKINEKNTLFIFNDNAKRSGTGGNAVIRGNANAMGIATGTDAGGVGFNDIMKIYTDERGANRTAKDIIDSDMEKIKNALSTGKYDKIRFSTDKDPPYDSKKLPSFSFDIFKSSIGKGVVNYLNVQFRNALQPFTITTGGKKRKMRKDKGKSIIRTERKVRKHRGIIQTGGNTGRLRKGYKYTGRRLKNGKAEIVRVKRN